MMHKYYQLSELQEALREGVDTYTIVAVGLNADVFPVLFEVERCNQRHNDSQRALYVLAQTRRVPKQWFFDWRTFGIARHDGHDRVNVSNYKKYGESVSDTPLRSIWIAPHLHIDGSNQEDLAGIEVLSELPPAYALDGHFQRILVRAYEGYFLWCEQCNDWESSQSQIYHRHLEIAMDEEAFYCKPCQKYRKRCPHYASAEAFWSSVSHK